MSFVMFFDNGNTVQCTMWQLKKLPGTLTNHHFLVLKSIPAWPWWALISSPTPHCRIEYSFTFLYFLGHRNIRNKATLPLRTKQLRPFIAIRSNGQFIVAVIFKKEVSCVFVENLEFRFSSIHTAHIDTLQLLGLVSLLWKIKELSSWRLVGLFHFVKKIYGILDLLLFFFLVLDNLDNGVLVVF